MYKKLRASPEQTRRPMAHKNNTQIGAKHQRKTRSLAIHIQPDSISDLYTSLARDYYVWEKTIDTSVNLNLYAPYNCLQVFDLMLKNSLVSFLPKMVNCAG